MCTPSIYIRDDGKGFVVRRGGVDFEMDYDCHRDCWIAHPPDIEMSAHANTILEAVDNALAKLRAVSPQEDK